jgi:hypothetical protein
MAEKWIPVEEFNEVDSSEQPGSKVLLIMIEVIQ